MASGKFANVIVEPHRKQITGQSDLETALHTLIDHLREPLLAMKGGATDFCHVFNESFHLGDYKRKNRNGGNARIFAPRIDMRETASAFFIDIELPGVHDLSCLKIAWRSDRELTVEGFVERPGIVDVFAPPYTGDARAHQNGDSYQHRDVESGLGRDSVTTAPQGLVQAPAYGDQKTSDHFPLDIVDGRQLDEGDSHRVEVPLRPFPNGDSAPSVTIGEREVGKFMRCFVFPHGVNVQGPKSDMMDGLLRMEVTKARMGYQGQDNGFRKVE